MTTSFRKFLSDISEYSEANNLLAGFTETLSYEKNEVLLARGKVPHRFLFIEQGTVIGTRLLHDEFITHRFWIAGQLLFPADSLFTNLPMNYSCTAIEQTTATSISYNKLIEFTDLHPDGKQVIIRLFNADLRFWQDRVRALTELSPLDRYKKLRSEYPLINQLVKSEFIASYMNMSVATLARVRKLV